MLTEDQQRVKALVEVFNTPIVFEPGGWADTLPEWLRGRVITERVEMIDDGGWDIATDAEVTCYLYTAALNHPLGSDWTEITLFEAAKQIPHLREALEAVPERLSQYQESELRDLKYKIRNSQLRRQKQNKKEVTMPKRKIVMDEKEGSVLMGIMKENADPVIKTVEGTLENALAAVPQLIQDAEAKWATSLKNPVYVAPPAPKKATTAPVTKSEPGKTTEELPLLQVKAKDKEAEKPSEVTAEATAAPVSEAKPEAVPIAVTPAATAPQEVVQAPAPAPAPVAPAPQPAPAAAPTSGEWQYFLEDGHGPYPDIQTAMDELGIDKTNRPHHNRWDRLSTEFKKKIQRRAKV